MDKDRIIIIGAGIIGLSIGWRLAKAGREVVLFDRDRATRRRSLRALSRRLPGRPFLRFAYQFFFRGGFLEGRSGLAFSLLMAWYEGLIVVKRWELDRVQQGQAQLESINESLDLKVYELAEASAVQPFAYLQLVFASTLGMTVFGETLRPNVAIGAAIIVAAACTVKAHEVTSTILAQAGGEPQVHAEQRLSAAAGDVEAAHELDNDRAIDHRCGFFSAIGNLSAGLFRYVAHRTW